MGRRRWAVLAVLCASLLLVAMDATILNVALPSLIDELRPDARAQLWIIDVYGLVLGGLLIASGALSDRWGRKLLFLSGFVLFGVASVVAATADTPAQLIGGRVLLGVGGAMVMPSTLSLIRHVFTDPRERATAIGVWAAVAGAGASVGPLIGGFLVERYSWSAAFWVNVPVVVVTVVAGLWLLPESRDPRPGRLDWPGVAMSITGVVSLAWGIKRVAKGSLAPDDLAVLALGLLLLGTFARRQLHLEYPLLDVRLFRNRVFSAAALCIFMAMLAIGAALYLVSLWLQYVHGYSPFEAGLRTVPAALAGLAGALLAPRLMSRVDVRLLLVTGLGTMAAGFALLTVTPTPTPYLAIAVMLAAVGFGDGLAITSATSVLVSAVPPNRAGQAGAVSESSYEMGVGFGVALLGTVHGALFTSRMTGLPLAGAELREARGSIGGAEHVGQRIGGERGTAVLEAARDAFDSALVTTAWASVGIVLAVMAVTAMLVPTGFRATPAH
ncbi:MFS transporter [Streptomyces sp. 549]|uniref:MFS transporter n=1 Tax=Streptomyces sp. 549 TaxID=3049076 RepID=UPI0024C3BDEA|nr:MFS transporter [Streptomyces sp. 549]MDK1476318.1 MFS transporter [Streptomyces sp. 549]